MATWYPASSGVTDVTVVLRAHGRGRESGEARDELDHLGHRHEPVGVAPVITIAG